MHTQSHSHWHSFKRVTFGKKCHPFCQFHNEHFSKTFHPYCHLIFHFVRQIFTENGNVRQMIFGPSIQISVRSVVHMNNILRIHNVK